MTKPTAHAHLVPASAHPVAMELYEKMKALAVERTTLMAEYMDAQAKVEEQFAARSADLIGRINEAKIVGSKAICEAAGVPYNPDAGYAIDTGYIDLGYVFIQVMERPESGLRFDGQSNDLPPLGTKLN